MNIRTAIDKYSLGEVSISEEVSLEANIVGDIQCTKKLLREAGFSLFVSPDFALQFKYVAGIHNLAQHLFDVYCCRHLVMDAIENQGHGYRFNGDGWEDKPVFYEGKLPIWVINRIRLAVGMGIQDITIHSNDKELMKGIIVGDPVIVGWVGFSKLFDFLIKNKGRMPRWYFSAKNIQPKNPFGFIIAIFGAGDII